MKPEFKPFQTADWMCYAGAEKFPDGSDPLVALGTVDGNPACFLVDANGAEVHWEVGESGEKIVTARLEGSAVFRLLALGDSDTTVEFLRALGAEFTEEE